MLATSAVVPSANTRFLWNEIVRWTFEACILRKEGRENEVRVLLHERLPALIRAWSERCGQPAEANKEQLRALFARAQESVELGSIQRRFIVEEVCARLARPGAATTPIRPAEGSSGFKLRRRVPIDDIPAMLDALAEADFESMGEAILPLRRSVTAAAELSTSDEPAQMALSA